MQALDRIIFSAVRCASVAALLTVFAAPSATADGINLSWDNCGAAGIQTKTFACNTNLATPFDLVGSFTPPAGINQLLGMSADLNVGSTSLPDWWKHGVGECRGTTNLSSDFSFTSGACSLKTATVNNSFPMQSNRNPISFENAEIDDIRSARLLCYSAWAQFLSCFS